jgi:riboflavin synthase
MFTGIIEEIGHIKKIATKNQAMELSIGATKILEDVKLGDSIAINGVCLTVTDFSKDSFSVDVMPETFRATSMATLSVGSPLNLERALAIGDRLGGHFVTGHVDGVAKITQIMPIDNAVNYTLEMDSELIKHCIFRGSIAVDGISLTIFGVTDNNIQLSIIPHTVSHTILGSKKVGEKVNIECDMLSKHVANLIDKK